MSVHERVLRDSGLNKESVLNIIYTQVVQSFDIDGVKIKFKSNKW